MLNSLFRHLFCQPHMARRIVVLLLSVTLMGACVAVFDLCGPGFGTDPCTVLNLAVARLLNIQFGTYQLLFNIVLLVIILLCHEGKRIGLGSLANMVLVGYSKDFFDWLIRTLCPGFAEASLGVHIAAFVPMMGLFLVAVSFYMVVELGVAPYDAIPQIISAHAPKAPFALVRVSYDIAATVIGFALGGTVGIVTVITGFFLGPVIQAIANKFRPLFA